MDYQNDPWADALAQQENERRSQRDAQMQRDQTAINDEMTEVVRRNAMENAKRQMSFNNLLASAVKYSNGGELPEVVRNFMNRKMGFDGVNTGVLGGGYQQDGSYAFDFANGVDQQGAVVRQRQSFGPTSLYNMMSQNRVAFNDADRSSMRKNLLHLGYSEREVSDMDSALASSYGGSNQASSASAQSGKVADPDHISNHLGADGRSLGSGAVMKTYDRRPHGVEMYSNFREPGMTAGGYVSGRKADGTRYGYNLGRQKSEAELWHQFLVGPSDDGKTQVRGYKNELTKEVVYVKDGENPPWRQSQGNNGKLSVDDRLAIEREKNKGKIDVENARGQNRIDLANLTGEQKKELQNSINAMKKYGIDVTSAVRMAIGGNRTKNVPFNDKVFTYYSNRLDVLNSKGTLTAAEQKERDKAQRVVDGMTNGVMGIEEKQETPDWMSAFASGDAANTAKPQNREGLKPAQNAQVQKPSNTKSAQAPAAPQGEDFGLRPDGTKKGNGWFGVLRNSKGQAVTEYSMQSEAVKVDGKRIDFPMLVPTLNDAEKNAVLAASANEQYDKDAFASAEQKAVDHARARLADGKSVWADEGAKNGTKQSAKSALVTKLTPAEQSVGRDAVATFKKIHPDITDVDDNPEKYDKQLTSIAQSLSGDYNYKSNFTLQKERDRKAAQDKELKQTAAEQENLRKQTLANLNGRDKAVYQKAMELYAPLYERAKLQAREDHGGDYEESVRKKFAEYVNEYNAKHGLKFVDGLSRPDRQVFGDYHVADLLSDIFGNDAGKYLGPGGSRGNSQLRLQSHGKNK